MKTVFCFRQAVGALATLCVVAIASDSSGQNNLTTPELNAGGSRLNASQEKDLASFYASRLFLNNHSAMTLNKIASTRASSPALRKFASKCLLEHNHMAESLRSMVPSSVATMASHKPSTASPNQFGRDLDDDNGLEDDDLWDDDGTTSNAKTKQTIVSRVSYTEISDPALRRVADIERGASKTRLMEATASMSRLRGHEFDMAFIHHNIASCENLLIELKAVSSIGSRDFQTLVGTANRMITTHLTAARELAESSVDNLELDELEGDKDWDEDDDG